MPRRGAGSATNRRISISTSWSSASRRASAGSSARRAASASATRERRRLPRDAAHRARAVAEPEEPQRQPAAGVLLERGAGAGAAAQAPGLHAGHGGRAPGARVAPARRLLGPDAGGVFRQDRRARREGERHHRGGAQGEGPLWPRGAGPDAAPGRRREEPGARRRNRRRLQVPAPRRTRRTGWALARLRRRDPRPDQQGHLTRSRRRRLARLLRAADRGRLRRKFGLPGRGRLHPGRVRLMIRWARTAFAAALALSMAATAARAQEASRDRAELDLAAGRAVPAPTSAVAERPGERVAEAAPGGPATTRRPVRVVLPSPYGR